MVVGDILHIQSKLLDLCLILIFYWVDMDCLEVEENIRQK